MSKKITGYALGVDENKQILPIGEEQKAMVEVPNELTKEYTKNDRTAKEFKNTKIDRTAEESKYEDKNRKAYER